MLYSATFTHHKTVLEKLLDPRGPRVGILELCATWASGRGA